MADVKDKEKVTESRKKVSKDPGIHSALAIAPVFEITKDVVKEST